MTTHFRARLEKAGFPTEAPFKAAFMDTEALVALTQSIENFDARIAAATDRRHRATIAVQKLERPDLPLLAAALGEKRAATEQGVDTITKTSAQLAAID